VGGDIGNATVLQEYERERYVKNLGMMTLVDGINRVFKDGTGAQHKMGAGAAAQEAEQALGATKVRPERLEVGPKLKQFLRSAGMLGIHQLGPVKSRIAKFAMGVDSK
jgi:2-polyprenyl-6-methoxyphenol hydroxylase-like FAD-dependent oxidoreductase